MAYYGTTGFAADTTTTYAISATATTLVLVSNVNWPDASAGNFIAVIENATAKKESVLCSRQSNGTVTILTRGYLGSTAVAHATGVTISVIDLDSNITSISRNNITVLGKVTESYTDAITATAGGGQANAVQVSTVISRVTVVATAGDSVKLPVAGQGSIYTINNASANSLNIFPAVGDAINALAANAAYALSAGKTLRITSTALGFWNTTGDGVGSVSPVFTGTITGQGLNLGAPNITTTDYTLVSTDVFIINNKATTAAVLTLGTATAGKLLFIDSYAAFGVNSASANVIPKAGGAAGTTIIGLVAGASAMLIGDGTNFRIVQ
jgi:hypothetical protein